MADACRLGAYRAAHRLSQEQRDVRAFLAVRESLVRSRVKYISLIRTLTRRDGHRVRSSSTQAFLACLDEVKLSDALTTAIAPLRETLRQLNDQLKMLNRRIEEISKNDETVARLCTVPGVGPVTAVMFVATLDRADRFRGAHEVESYLGLVPSERSSGEKQHKGRITKSGNTRMRWLLVEAAWSILIYEHPSTEKLRVWAQRIVLRRGKKIAAVALARRLAGILYAIWRDESSYQPERIGVRSLSLSEAA